MKSFRRMYILLLLVCCIFSGFVNAQNKSDTSNELKTVSSNPLVTEEFIGDDLKVVLDYLAEETKVNITYEDSIEGKVTCRFNKEPLSKVLQVILSATPYKIKKIDDNYFVYFQDDSIVSKTFQGDIRALGEPAITNVFIGDDLLAVLDIISADTGFNIMYGMNVMGIVTCKLENVPLNKALEIILAATPYKAEKRGSYYVITESVTRRRQLRISGNIGIANVKMEGLPGEVYADANGYYSANVEAGFSGKIQPVKEGYEFNPSFVIYNNLKSDRKKQDYKAAVISPNKSLQKKMDVPIVTEEFVGDDIMNILDLLAEQAEINIMYDESIVQIVSCSLNSVPLNKALEIITSPTEYIVKRMDDYYLVISPDLDDIKNQVAPKKTVILGNITLPLASIIDFPCEIVSGPDGSYSVNIPTGFSGKIFPRKEDEDFTPFSEIYSAVPSALTNQDNVVENTEIDEPLVTNEYVNEDLRDALYFLTIDTGINIMYDVSVQGNITCKFKDMPLSKALEIILAATPYRAKKMDGYYLVYSLDNPAGKISPRKEIQKAAEPKITETFVDDDLLVVLDIISSNTGINIIYGTNVQGIVNCTLKNIPLGKALELILAATPYTAKKRDNYYVVTEYLSSDKQYHVSGNVGIAKVRMDGLPGEIYTDVNGYYTASVKAGFSGKVQPVKEGYNFNPSYIIYNNLNTKRIGQDYKAKEVSLNQPAQKKMGEPVISEAYYDDELWDVLNSLAEETGINILIDESVDGIINCRLNKVPLSKALEIILSATPYIIKKMDSYYLVLSPGLDDIKNRGTSNEVTISENIGHDKQEYKAQFQTLTISDTIKYGKNKPIPGIEITAEPGGIKTVTDSKGQFSIQVPYGWTGEIILSKPGIAFTPDSVSYKNVTTDIIKGVPVPSQNTIQ